MSAPRGATDQTATGFRFLTGVIARHWILLLLGLGSGLGTGVLAGVSAPDRFSAETTFVIENSAGAGTADRKTATDQVAELMPTIAQLAKSDDVLRKVRDEANLSDSVSTLRSRVTASIPFQTLTLVVRIELDKVGQADAAMKSFNTNFAQRVTRVWGTGTFVAIPIQEHSEAKIRQSFVTVLVIASLIGLLLAMVVVFVIDNA